MTALLELLNKIQKAGGQVWLEDFTIHYKLPKKHKRRLLAELRRNKSAVLDRLLEQQPKTLIRVPCTCDEKPYPHFTHDTPVIPNGAVMVKGNLKDLWAALGEVQQLYRNNWKMRAPLLGLEQNRWKRNNQEGEV